MPSAVAGFLVTALGGAAALGAVGVAIINVAVGLAFSALSQAISGQADSPPVETKSTTLGDTSGQSFMLGNYATGGHLGAIRYSHRSSGGAGAGTMRTTVIRLSDVPLIGSELRKIIVNGTSILLNGAVHADYGVGTLSSKYSDKIWVKFYDGSQTVADPMMLDKYGSHSEKPWLSTHVGKETAYAIITQKHDPELWRGDTRFRFEIIGGIPLYDISKDGTAGGVGPHRWDDRSTWEPTANPQVIKYNVIRGIRCKGGFTYGGQGVEAEDLPADNWIPAIEACRQPRETAFFNSIAGDALDYLNENFGGSSFQIQRYMFGYEVNLAAPENGGTEPAQLIEYIDQSCGGATVDLGGTVLTRVGLPQLPSRFVSDDDLYVDHSQTSAQFSGLEETYNAVNASYVSIAENYEPREAEPARDLAAEAEDGRYLPANLNLHGVTNESQAQDLIGMYLRDGRRMVRHTATFPPEFMTLTPLDALDWTSTAHGYDGKDFEVGEIAVDPSTLSTTVSMREIDPTDDALRETDEVLVVPASTEAIVYPPEIVPNFTAAGASVNDGLSVPRRTCGTIGWSELEGDVKGLKYEVRIKGTIEIVERGQTPSPTVLQHIIRGADIPNTTYEVRTLSIVDREATWSAWAEFTTPDVRLSGPDIADGAIALNHVASDVTATIASAQNDATVALSQVATAQAEIDAAELLVAAAQSDITAINGEVQTLQTAVTTNAAAVSQNQTAITTADTAIANLTNTVTAGIAARLVSDFADGDRHWTYSTTGSPDTRPDLYDDPDVTEVVEAGESIPEITATGGSNYISPKAVLHSEVGRTYRVRFQVKQTSGSVEVNSIRASIRRMPSTFAAGQLTTEFYQPTAINTWQEFALEYTNTNHSDRELRPFVGTSSSAAVGDKFRFRLVEFSDVTQENLEAAQASITATAVSDLEGNQAASIALRTVAGSAGAFLELVSADDPTGAPISGAKIKAEIIELDGNVIANSLYLRGNNYVVDGDFSSGTVDRWWPFGADSEAAITVEAATSASWPAANAAKFSTATTQTISMYSGSPSYTQAGSEASAYYLKQGEQYRVNATCWSNSDSNLQVRLYGRRQDGTYSNVLAFSENIDGDGWQYLTGTVTVPSDWIMCWMRLFAPSLNGTAYFTNLELKKMDGSDLIVDGSVVANHLAANSITAANGAIADLAVGTLQIAGGAVTRTYHNTTLVSTSITTAYQDILSQVVVNDVGYQTAVEFEIEIKPTSATAGDLVTVRVLRITNGVVTVIKTYFHEITDTTRQYIKHVCYDTGTGGGNPNYAIEAKKVGATVTVSDGTLRTQQVKR